MQREKENRKLGLKSDMEQIFFAFYGTQGSLFYSQEPATRPCPKPDDSSLYPHPISLRSSLFSLSCFKGTVT